MHCRHRASVARRSSQAASEAAQRATAYAAAATGAASQAASHAHRYCPAATIGYDHIQTLHKFVMLSPSKYFASRSLQLMEVLQISSDMHPGNLKKSAETQ